MGTKSDKERERTLHRAKETALDVAIGAPALAAQKAVEVVDEIVGRAEDAMRSGRQEAKHSIASARRAVLPGDARAYEDRTRDELYELAMERDIEGRSSMRKAELIAALREQR